MTSQQILKKCETNILIRENYDDLYHSVSIFLFA